MGSGMPSARGVEWKGREVENARKKWYENWDKAFGRNKTKGNQPAKAKKDP